MEAVSNMAQHMVAKKHPAVHAIDSKLSSLRADLRQLKELTATRKLKLIDAVESQTVSCFAALCLQFARLSHCFVPVAHWANLWPQRIWQHLPTKKKEKLSLLSSSTKKTLLT